VPPYKFQEVRIIITQKNEKTKFMIENVEKDSKIKLLHREYERYNKEFHSMVNYLLGINENINKVNIDDKLQMDELLLQISKEAQDVKELKIS